MRIVDPATNGIIFCVNRLHLESEGWDKEFNISSLAMKNKIDVTKCNHFESKAFENDSPPSPNQIPRFLNMFVDFSCLMDYRLRTDGEVIVHCKRGRSRSPTVILAFLMLRGLSREHAEQWLTNSFREQRPRIARISINFPNFVTFGNVLTVNSVRNTY